MGKNIRVMTLKMSLIGGDPLMETESREVYRMCNWGDRRYCRWPRWCCGLVGSRATRHPGSPVPSHPGLTVIRVVPQTTIGFAVAFVSQRRLSALTADQTQIGSKIARDSSCFANSTIPIIWVWSRWRDDLNPVIGWLLSSRLVTVTQLSEW